MAVDASTLICTYGRFKPHLLMVLAQIGYTFLYFITEASFNHGMNPHVYITYRHIVAGLGMLPFAYFLERYILHLCIYIDTQTNVIGHECYENVCILCPTHLCRKIKKAREVPFSQSINFFCFCLSNTGYIEQLELRCCMRFKLRSFIS